MSLTEGHWERTGDTVVGSRDQGSGLCGWRLPLAVRGVHPHPALPVPSVQAVGPLAQHRVARSTVAAAEL